MTALLASTDREPDSSPAAGTLPLLQSNFGWALAGNVLFAACQWGMLIALARLGSPEVVGQFSLGLAIATPIITLANLQLRSVQATDAANRYSFTDYFRLRGKTTVLAVLAVVVITAAAGWRASTALVVLFVALAKAVESFSDVHYGLFQNREQLETVAKSMALRGTLGVSALAAGLYFTGQAACAVAALVLAWGLVLLRFDIRRGGGILTTSTHAGSVRARNAAARWISFHRPFLGPTELNLARTAFPLGIVTALTSLQLNMPRYFVQWKSGVAILGIFSAIAYLGTLLTVFIDSLGLAVAPRLAKLFHAGELRAFMGLVMRLVALGITAGLAGIAVAAGAGGFVLRVAYGAEYSGYRDIFVWLMTAAGIGCVGTLLCCALTAGGFFRQQVPLYAVVVATAAIGCAALTRPYGARGAAMAMVLAAGVHVVLSSILLARMLSLRGQAARSVIL
ncbi:MAG TPA: hypothetical protein VMH80_17150 [Bryobacteraceae bacterium]|nr:hypothetical protein [Bryobacteraceae bacterium]